MKNLISALSVILITCITTISMGSPASKKSHHAHSHGVATLGLVLEDTLLSIEFTAPAHDLLGFENKPKNDSQKSKVQLVRNQLAIFQNIILLPESAGCKMKKFDLSGEVFERGMDSKEESHSDVQVNWQFQCAKTSELKKLSVEAFTHFKSIQKLSVTTVNNSKQGSYQLTAKNKVIAKL